MLKNDNGVHVNDTTNNETDNDRKSKLGKPILFKPRPITAKFTKHPTRSYQSMEETQKKKYTRAQQSSYEAFASNMQSTRNISNVT